MNKKKLKTPILIQFAMEIEATPFIKKVGARKTYAIKTVFPFKFFEATFAESTPLIIAIAGKDKRHKVDSMGAVPAALQSAIAIEKFKPRMIINAGTAGGYEGKGASIGEVHLGTRHVAFHDRRSLIPKVDVYGRGHFPVMKSEKIAKALGIKEGIVSTGGALDCTDVDQKYIDLNEGTLKDMEAAAIGYVCEKYKVPFLPVKTVTDFVDHPSPTHEQFVANYEVAVSNLTSSLVDILNHLVQKKVKMRRRK